MLALFLASALTLERAAVSDLCHKFAAAFERRNVVALRAIAVPGADFKSDPWHDVLDLVERTHSINIEREEICSVRAEGATVMVELRLIGSAVSLGPSRRPVVLPEMWQLEIDMSRGSAAIRSAMPAEHTLASAIVAQKDDDARRRLLAVAEFDRHTLPMAIAWIAADSTDERGPAALQFALQMSQQNGDRLAEAVCLRMLANLHVSRRENAQAIDAALKSLGVARAARSVDAECAALFVLGIAEWLTNDPVAAVHHLDQAGSLADDADDARSPIKAIYMAGYILHEQRRFSLAIEHIQRSQQLSEKYGWKTGVVDALLTIASIHDQLQNVEISAQMSRRAYEAALSMGDYKNAAFAMYNVAEAQLRLGLYERAIASVGHVLRFRAEGSPWVPALDLLGQALTNLGRYDEADKALSEAVAEATERDDRRVAQLALAHLSDERLRRGRYTQALEFARKAIVLSESGEGASRMSNDFRPWIAWTAAGRALQKLGRSEEAIAAFRRAIDLIEAARQSAPAGDETLTHSLRDAGAYVALIDLLARRGDASSALKVSEKIKGRALRDAIETGRADLESLMTREEKERERELSARVADLSRQVLRAAESERARVTEEADRAEEDLQAFAETIYLARTRAATTNATEAFDSSSLRPDVMILDYAVTETSTVVLEITRKATRMKRVAVRRSELRARTEAFTRDLERRDLRWKARARELYDMLVKPFESSFRSHKLICIIPDDVLWHLPFEALVSADGVPLLEKVPLFYSPSLSFLGVARDEKTAFRPRSVLSVGDPASTPQALPEAEEEAEAVASLYAEATVLTGRRARETTIKQTASRYDVLHFATHALIDDRSPMFSSLIFAGDADNDGLLQARELVRLNLRARLAVLSACKTGGGAIYPGEGVVGLSWALLFAGCPRSVVTGWMVNSRGAADLMIAFHRELTSGGATTAEALRRAALQMREQPQYRHPYYWAAFHVVGIGW